VEKSRKIAGRGAIAVPFALRLDWCPFSPCRWRRGRVHDDRYSCIGTTSVGYLATGLRL